MDTRLPGCGARLPVHSWLQSTCRVGALVLALIVIAPARSPGADVLTQDEAVARSARISQVAYALALELKPGSSTFAGRAVVDFTLRDAASDLRVDFQWGRLDRLALNGSRMPAPGEADRARCVLILPHALLAPGANHLEVDYVNAFDRSGDGFHRVVDPQDGREYAFTNFEPFYAHRMLPCFDQPDIKAPLALRVTAPRTWRVIANSPEVLDVGAVAPQTGPDSASRLHTFAVTPAISTYLYFVAAGPYMTWVDPRAPVPARIFARASMARYTPARELFDITRRGLAFYPRYFKVPFPFTKYDQIFVPELDGDAMENPGAIAIHDHNLYRSEPTQLERQDRASTMLHEMSHMWFGDLVTMRWWDGLWLNESFATYMESFALSKATEFRNAFEEFNDTKAEAYRADQLPTTHPVAGKVADTDAAVTSFDSITYNKGAALLKQLAFYIGPDRFRAGVTDYFRRHAWGTTQAADFFRSEAAAAGRDLSEWCRTHFETAGVNALQIRMSTSGGKIARLFVDQTKGNAQAIERTQRLMVALYARGADGVPVLTRTVPITIHGPSTRVRALEGEPVPALVWPNAGDQAYARVLLDPVSLATVRGQIDRIADGLERRGLWLSLWEMTRDGLLPAADFIRTAMDRVSGERDPALLARVLGEVLTAAIHFVPDDGDQTLARIHTWASGGLAAAAPGSDAQKEWFHLYVRTATTGEALAELEDLLDGHRSIPGFVLDQTRRWDVLLAICGRGRPGAAARIAGEHARDATDQGDRMALQCQSALPDPAIKEAMFHRFLTDTEASVDLLAAGMNGFFPVDQASITRPFVKRYFDAVLAMRGHREPEMVETFAAAMFPSTILDPAVVDEGLAFLRDHPDLTEDLRRPIANGIDELARALRVRKTSPRAATEAGR